MPNYIDLFGAEVENKKQKFIQYLTKGRELKYLESDYEKQFNRFFITLKNHKLKDENFEALAIDASGKKREFLNGVYFYVTRASGIQNNGKKIRILDTNVFTITGSNTEVDRYFGRKSEHIEFKVLKSYIDNQEKRNEFRVCFIDGSIYNRLMSPVFEFTVEEDEKFMLDYFELVFDVIQRAKDKNIILIGVSKDSREIFFRNALLDEIYYEERENLKKSGNLNGTEISIIESVIKKIDEYNEENVKKFKRLVNNKPNLLKKMLRIYNEYHYQRTDGEIIYRFAKSSGYTYPMEKGLGRPEQINLFKVMINKTQTYLLSRFKKFLLNLNGIDKQHFILRGEKILKRFSVIPTFISFHILPDIRDNPIKIDVPSWCFKNYNRLIDYPYVNFYNTKDPIINKILFYNMKMYGGLSNYNLLLSAAHNDAVLREKTYNEIYEQFLQDKLELILPHRRRTKRELYG